MFDFTELDATTRTFMLRQFRQEQGDTLIGPYRPRGYVGTDDLFIEIMETAIEEGDEDSLTLHLQDPLLWEEEGIRIVRGRAQRYRDPFDVQARRFAITEYNTWYVRGLTARLLDEGVEECEVYRADHAYHPRTTCRQLEGLRLRTQDVYEGHRRGYHHASPDRHALSIPLGPNCHHSIRRASE